MEASCYRKVSCFLALLFLVIGTTCKADSNHDARPLTFGFLPVVSTEKLVRRFSPLVDYLSEQLGRDIRMESAPNFERFIDRTHHQHRYDILFTAPHTYYMAHKEAGYRALVQVDLPGLRAVIVTRKDSGIDTLDKIAGKALSTVDPLALATILARKQLEAAGIDPDTEIELVYTPSNDASLISMLHGNTDAAVAMMPVYLRLDPESISRTQIIARSELMPHIPISVAPWVPESLASRIKHVLLDMSHNVQGRQVLKQINWVGFTEPRTEQYRHLEWVVREIDK